VLSHTEEKTARRVVEQAEAALEFLDKELAALGPGEYMRRPILRVCVDPEERRSFSRQREPAPTWLPGNLEVLACWDPRGPTGFEFGYLNIALLQHFLTERATEVRIAMPPWIAHGLESQVESLRVGKYGKLELLPDYRDLDELTVQTQHGRGIPPKELFRLTEKSIGGAASLGRYAQSDALVRYLFSQACEKDERTKSLLALYLTNLQAAVADRAAETALRVAELKSEAQKRSAETLGEAALDPAEEEARWRRKVWLEGEQALIEDLWFRTFRSFEEKDWKHFEKTFAKFID
jgi:hypothetical protein